MPEQQQRAVESRAARAAKADKYRKKAEACRLEAQKAEVEENRVKWLEVAQQWEQSAEKLEARKDSDAAGVEFTDSNEPGVKMKASRK
jgi:hypothetical protein